MVLVDHTGWKLRCRQWTGTTEQLIEQLESTYDNAPNMFLIRIHHGGKFQRYPGRMYVSGRVDIFDMVDIDLFTVVALNMMVLKLGYIGESEPMFYNYLRPLTSLDEGLYALACDEDVRCLFTLVRSFKLIEVYIEHGVTVLVSYLRAPQFRATLEDIIDEPAGSIAANRTKKMLLLTWHKSSETTKEPVCDSVTPSSFPQHDSSIPCKDSICASITPRCMPDCILTPPTYESVITYTQLSGVHGVDIQSHVLPTIQSQFSNINLSFVSQQATASQVIDDVMRQLSFDETELDEEAGFADVAGSGVDSSGLIHVETQYELLVSEEPDVGPAQEPILVEVSTQEPIMAEIMLVKRKMGKTLDKSSEDAGTDDDDDVDEDFLVDEENEIIEPDVDVHLFGISMDLPFDNIGITNLVSDDVLGEDMDVINVDGFDSGPGNDEERNYRKIRLAELRTEMEGVINASGQWKYSFYTGQKFNTPKEAKDRVYLHSIKSRRNLKLYKNDSVRIRARCEGKVLVFTMSQGTGPTGPNRGMEVGPSGLSGPTTRSKKKKNTGTNDDSQASPSFLDAHDKGDLCPWVLYVGKDKFTQNWVVKTHKDTHTCLQSREIKHYTYKFLSEKIFEQVRANPDIPVKAVQDQLQRELKIQISMSKVFRAKAKAEREIRGDHVLQYSMLRDYVVELQSTNPNTTVKIAVERNTDPSLPTRVFQRIYVCLGALKLGFRACRSDLLGLDGAFMKGPFPGQVLVAVGLDSNNGIYPLAYSLVEAESKSSLCWFLQCFGDDIDLHPNSNFTFISDRQKGIIPAIKIVYPSAEHRHCLRHIHENMKQGWCGQAYKDLLWRATFATNVKDFQKCMLELKMMNPKAHEWLNKILAEHWARSYFSGRAKSDLLLNNICEVFNGKIVGGRDKPVITLLEYIREYCMKRIVNVQGVIDKCTGSLTPTATRIMESIKKEAHLTKVQWNEANKYQVSGSLGDQCVVDVVSMTCSCRKWELIGIPYKHVITACWNMALNGRAAPPPETWVNHCYWLSTWNETYSHKIQPICETNYWEKSTCPTTLLPPKHHVQVGRPKKKRKRSKHEDEPFVKDGKLSRKGRTITCQSCGNIRHNKATCKGQGRKATTGGNNAEGSGSASRQAQQTQPTVDQDGSGGSGFCVVLGLSAAGEGAASGPGGHDAGEGKGAAGVARQGSSRSQVPMSQTRNADGREMGDGVPTQLSAAGGASEWSFL
ncbi:heat stress transcription factor B-4-like protein [Tanacetum coccineum]|uniref:Heat stress transcription factor B-4-like protein n=1 Tax=Tanacetum coccineum TaxID=301880 RepID=A0ABQ5HI91_9ASTR